MAIGFRLMGEEEEAQRLSRKLVAQEKQRARKKAENAATSAKRAEARKHRPGTKVQVTIRLDPDVLKGLRAQGDGWQSRINGMLRKVLGLG